MITLVTDSTAYLTKEEADRLKLRVVPMHYTIAGNSYTEGFADENKNFVDKIAANPDLCATAQASVADFVGMFQAIVHQGGEVLIAAPALRQRLWMRKRCALWIPAQRREDWHCCSKRRRS